MKLEPSDYCAADRNHQYSRSGSASLRATAEVFQYKISNGCGLVQVRPEQSDVALVTDSTASFPVGHYISSESVVLLTELSYDLTMLSLSYMGGRGSVIG
jgi:hypothetical protein